MKCDLINYMPKEITAAEKVIRTIMRDELKNFATKDELKNFATKDDLKNFATKDDLKNFATKDEMSSKFNEVMNTLDGMYGLLKKNSEELSVMNHRVYKIQDPKLENHEKRITRLEVSAA